MSIYLADFISRVGRIVLIGLVSALCVASNYAMLPLWNVKLMDTVVFVSAFLFGLSFGVSVAIIPWLIYGTLNPFGFSFPTLVSVAVVEIVYALAGHLVSRRPEGFYGKDWFSVQNIGFGVVGLVSTLLYDLFTNAIVGWLFYGSILVGLLTMNFPIPLGIIHEVSNFFFFALLSPPIIRTVQSGFIQGTGKDLDGSSVPRRKVGQRERLWFFVSLGLIALLVVSTSSTFYYYSAYTNSEQRYTRLVSDLRKIANSVNLLIEFSNGTKVWHNDTFVPIGWSLFNLTLAAVDGEVEYQTMYGSVFVTGIGGVKGSGALFWLWYSWNSTSHDWDSAMIGPDQYVLHDGDTLAWYLADTSKYPNIPKP
jgi:hypothetical protein